MQATFRTDISGCPGPPATPAGGQVRGRAHPAPPPSRPKLSRALPLQPRHPTTSQHQMLLARAVSLGTATTAGGHYPHYLPMPMPQQQQPQHQQLQLLRRQQPDQAALQGGGHLTSQKKQLSAQELTGAPLISYVPKNRRVKKKMSEPNLRARHSSQPSFYLGQNLYRNMQLQDFYHNPVYAVHSSPYYSLDQPSTNLRKEGSVSKSCDTLSDSYSVSSEDLETFVPRIIRPRRRRKKEKKKCSTKLAGEGEDPEDLEICLGSEKQWLPQGLLSAESSFDSRSDSGSSEDETRVRRKLGPALSVPAYTSYSAYSQPLSLSPKDGAHNSDYSSLNSNNSDTPPTSSSDHLFDSDSSRSESDALDKIRKSFRVGAPSSAGKGALPHKHPLKATKSNSASYFRSPKLDQKMGTISGCDVDISATASNTDIYKRHLRKTNSWHPTPQMQEGHGAFSLFSPAGSIDLLSGIRDNLSRLDLKNER